MPFKRLTECPAKRLPLYMREHLVCICKVHEHLPRGGNVGAVKGNDVPALLSIFGIGPIFISPKRCIFCIKPVITRVQLGGARPHDFACFGMIIMPLYIL